MRQFFERFLDLNPRIVYLVMAIVLIFPVLRPIGMPIVVDESTRVIFDWIENSEPGTIVFFDSAYSGGSSTEINPQLEAWAYHCFKKGLKIINVSQWQPGAMIASELMRKVAAAAQADGYDAEYGVDWVFVGWKSMVWRELREDFWLTAGNHDFWGNHFSTLPLMERVKKWDVPTSKSMLAFDVGSPGVGTFLVEWREHDIYVGCAAVQQSGLQSILRSGQIKGLMAGISGAAQYEKLLGRPGEATILMDAQSLGHVVIIVLVVLGNIAFFMKQKGASA